MGDKINTQSTTVHMEKPSIVDSDHWEPQYSMLEKVFATRTYTPRYPRWMVGKKLLWMTSLFGSLGDALFGYDQGK